jgi:signal transduction histidine kinase
MGADSKTLTAYKANLKREITKRKRMEKELISLAKFPSENPYAVLRIDKEGLVLYANPQSQKLPAPINMTPGQRVSESWRQHANRALSAKKNLDFVETINNRSFLFTVTPILIEGYVNVYGTEITDRVRAEEQLREAERFAAIGRTAAMVGHDLRNPLQAIVGNIGLAQEQLDKINCPPKEKREFKESLKEIKSTTFYMDKIVSDLQDYARQVKPLLVRTDLRTLIKETLLSCSIPQNVSVTIGVPNNFPTEYLDSSIIRRVLTNLITNSVQAMPEGGELTIKAFRKKNPKAIVITVEDSGVGIRPADRSRIFTPLFTTKSKGQGFGLPVCKRLIEGHGGAISFTSQVGKGTKFTIKLPILKEGKSRLQGND